MSLDNFANNLGLKFVFLSHSSLSLWLYTNNTSQLAALSLSLSLSLSRSAQTTTLVRARGRLLDMHAHSRTLGHRFLPAVWLINIQFVTPQISAGAHGLMSSLWSCRLQ